MSGLQRLKLIAVMLFAAAIMLSFSCCVSRIPSDGSDISVNGRETLFAPPESTAHETESEMSEATTDETVAETPADTATETTSPPASENTTAPAEPETEEPEDTVFGDGFSSLY